MDFRMMNWSRNEESIGSRHFQLNEIDQYLFLDQQEMLPSSFSLKINVKGKIIFSYPIEKELKGNVSFKNRK